MKDIFFWKEWHKPNRILYTILLAVFLLSLITLAISYFTGHSMALEPGVMPELESIKTSVDNFTQNLIHYSVKSQSYLVKEWYIAGDIQVKPWLSYCLLAVLFLSALF